MAAPAQGPSHGAATRTPARAQQPPAAACSSCPSNPAARVQSAAPHKRACPAACVTRTLRAPSLVGHADVRMDLPYSHVHAARPAGVGCAQGARRGALHALGQSPQCILARACNRAPVHAGLGAEQATTCREQLRLWRAPALQRPCSCTPTDTALPQLFGPMIASGVFVLFILLLVRRPTAKTPACMRSHAAARGFALAAGGVRELA